MNWKHENGYKVEGIIRGSERELYPIYSVKAQDGFAFVSPSYLDPWNSGHSAHLVKGVITEENPHNCVLKDDADGGVNGAQKPPIHGCKSQLPSQKIIRI